MFSTLMLKNCQSFARKPLLAEMKANQLNRLFRSEAKYKGSQVFGRRQTLTLKERLLEPTEGLPFAIGKGFVAGAAGLGIGALCVYGISLNKDSTFTRSLAWPRYIRDRIHNTYNYLGGSLIITAASAYWVTRSPVLMNLAARNTILAMIVSLGALVGSGMVAQSIPYKPGFGSKQVAWLVHSALIGGFIAPLAAFGSPLLLRAAIYTAGIVGGLSTVAVCAPSEKFLNISGPLAIGLGLVFASSVGSMFLPPTTAVGASLFSISVYGGLVLFSAFLLYDTQKIIKKAETYPPYSHTVFDPVKESISIYLDIINIFIRMITILGMSNSGKRR